MPAIVFDSFYSQNSNPGSTSARRRGPPLSMVHQPEEGHIQMPDLFVIFEEGNPGSHHLWISHNGGPDASFKEDRAPIARHFLGVRVGDDPELVLMESHPEFDLSEDIICLPRRPISFRVELYPDWRFQYTTAGGKVIQGESLQFNQQIEYAIGIWDGDEEEEGEDSPENKSNTSTSDSKRASEFSLAFLNLKETALDEQEDGGEC